MLSDGKLKWFNSVSPLQFTEQILEQKNLKDADNLKKHLLDYW